ncbi:hypothetical protein QF046_002445 [Microbacterium sp. W4I4]|uniref:hypothetical protein n=1 Tax=Microbacterium sp. W4I4 TaxID=3042295 RepID=UPI00278664A6|nr:hypothetical protein [Microbacterium sp. W4I4]MDQ0614804.1 hypothetical protein [Microbacterium sp. W4I4]
MVYAAPRPTTLSTARDRQRDGMTAFRAALDAIPPQHAAAVREYVAAVHAEAAARRTETVRLQAELNARTRGNHQKNGA